MALARLGPPGLCLAGSLPSLLPVTLTPGSLSLCLPRGRSVQTHVPGHWRDLHCEAWGQFPGRDPVCATWSAGGRDPEPVRVGQLPGRRVWAAEAPSHPRWPRGQSHRKPDAKGLRGARSAGTGPHESAWGDARALG